MTITFNQVITALQNGEVLNWEASGAYKSGSIILETAAKRRLFRVLIDADSNLVADADESLFQPLMDAWKDASADPAKEESASETSDASGSWRLERIESKGFGGLNTDDGPCFDLHVGGENWCLEGYNGSGKTSLANLIVWTLTGYRKREQDGLIEDRGERAPVSDSTGKMIDSWPPLAAYPSDEQGLGKSAEVWGRLTFEKADGETAVAERKITSPVEGDPVIREDIDPRLLASPELIETGLLMPARIGHIGFGDRSTPLYEALKMLTGLDRLVSVAVGAGGLSHKSKRFLKYAKDNDADRYERDFTHNLNQAKELAETGPVDLTENYRLGADTLLEKLQTIERRASEKAGASLDLLKTEIAPTLDLSGTEDRDRLNKAVGSARHTVGEGAKAVPLFDSLAALKKAGEDVNFRGIGAAVSEAEESLATALEWHARQKRDAKLRLKALASKFFIAEADLETAANCPLCDTPLTEPEQKKLAQELETLKSEADLAERAIADACRDIEKKLNTHVPEYLGPHLAALAEMDPASGFAKALKSRFAENSPFSDILIGIAAFATEYADNQASTLPAFDFTAEHTEPSEIAEVRTLRDLMSRISRAAALSTWWVKNRAAFLDAWNNLIGVAGDGGEWPPESLEGKLDALEAAIAESGPLDKIAKHVASARGAAEKWAKVNGVQKTRETIAESIGPLKQLQGFVDCETHRAIETLSGRVTAILDEIKLKDRFDFENTAMAKKTVTVEGHFTPGLKIDATLVANSSWLRALLWAFIFALREQTIANLGVNPFPLVVLDDPQTTFDPQNKRKWAEKIVDMANRDAADADGAQLFLATHERQFHDMVCMTYELHGQQGEMVGPTGATQVAHIVNGTFLGRQFDKAKRDKNDEEGYRYVQMVRVHCEDLLKIMLRPEAFEISGETLGKLCELLAKLRNDHIDPFNRTYFETLLNLLNEKTQPVIKIINASHHGNKDTIGYAQAEDVERYWREKLKKAFSNAFRLASDYDAYKGVPFLFAWNDNVATFPNGHKDKIKAFSFEMTSVAAAAESDGRVGDGNIMLEPSESGNPVILYNHSAYRLNAGTLDPVAGIGDVVLVRNFGAPRPRNLTVVAFGDQLYARRLNEAADHPDVVIFTGQGADPYSLPEPVIAVKDKVTPKKIVGTVFAPRNLPPPKGENDHEVSMIEDFSVIESRLKNVKLFEVKGRSMEPIALEGQYVMTLEETLDESVLQRLHGGLVIAADHNGSVYFKRLRRHGELVVLESANSNSTTSSEILSLDTDAPYPQLQSLMSVVGVLFDLPEQKH